MDKYALYLEWPVVDVLLYAVQHTCDDLEARAIVAEERDPERGPVSALEYRSHIRRLRQVTDQLGADTRPPNPEQVAVRWIDGIYTVVDGKPVRMLSQPELQRQVEATIKLHEQGLLALPDLLLKLREAVAPSLRRPPRAASARRRPPQHGSAPENSAAIPVSTFESVRAPMSFYRPSIPNERGTAQPSGGLQVIPFSAPKSAHRFAPGCRPAPVSV